MGKDSALCKRNSSDGVKSSIILIGDWNLPALHLPTQSRLKLIYQSHFSGKEVFSEYFVKKLNERQRSK